MAYKCKQNEGRLVLNTVISLVAASFRSFTILRLVIKTVIFCQQIKRQIYIHSGPFIKHWGRFLNSLPTWMEAKGISRSGQILCTIKAELFLSFDYPSFVSNSVHHISFYTCPQCWISSMCKVYIYVIIRLLVQKITHRYYSSSTSTT